MQKFATVDVSTIWHDELKKYHKSKFNTKFLPGSVKLAKDSKKSVSINVSTFEYFQKIFNFEESLTSENKTTWFNYKCKYCHKTLKSQAGYENHLLIHDQSKNVECSQCGKSFNSKNTLSVHKKNVHSDYIHECEYCGKLFSNISNKNRHLKQIHDNGVPNKLLVKLNQDIPETDIDGIYTIANKKINNKPYWIQNQESKGVRNAIWYHNKMWLIGIHEDASTDYCTTYSTEKELPTQVSTWKYPDTYDIEDASWYELDLEVVPFDGK